MRLMRLFAISAVLAGSMIGIAAPPASASTVPLCEMVFLRGDLVLPTDEGGCVPTMTAGNCDFSGYNTGLGLAVYTLVCLPSPLTGP